MHKSYPGNSVNERGSVITCYDGCMPGTCRLFLKETLCMHSFINVIGSICQTTILKTYHFQYVALERLVNKSKLLHEFSSVKPELLFVVRTARVQEPSLCMDYIKK